MAVRMDIEDFCKEIDPDVLKYTSAVLKHRIGKRQFARCSDVLCYLSRDIVYFCAVKRWIRNLRLILLIGSIAAFSNTSFLKPLDRGTAGLRLRPYLLIENISTTSSTFKLRRKSLLNSCKTSNVWLPNMSCFHPIRTCFPSRVHAVWLVNFFLLISKYGTKQIKYLKARFQARVQGSVIRFNPLQVSKLYIRLREQYK